LYESKDICSGYDSENLTYTTRNGLVYGVDIVEVQNVPMTDEIFDLGMVAIGSVVGSVLDNQSIKITVGADT
jgi:hypothetical protein